LNGGEFHLKLEHIPIELKKVGTIEVEGGYKRDISNIRGIFVKRSPYGLVDVPAGKYEAFYLLNNVVMLRPCLDSGDLSSWDWYAVSFDDLFVESL